MERERLTITLRKDVLKLVDQSIDGAKLRNRSHAIEYFLSLELAPKSVKVVLAVPGGGMRQSYQAGGMSIGIRDSFTETNGSNIRAIFRILAEQNFKEVLLAGADSTSLEAAAVDGERMGLNVRTEAVEPNSISSQLLEYVKNETFIYWDARAALELNLPDLLEVHKSGQGPGTAVLATSPASGSPIGLFGQVYGRKITAVGGEELKPLGALPLAGLAVFESEAVLTDKQFRISGVLAELARTGNLNGFVMTLNEMAKQTAVSRTAR